MKEKQKHGGSRKGAGRPRKFGKLRRVTVKITESDYDWLLSWAIDCNLSGVSAAVRDILKESREWVDL